MIKSQRKLFAGLNEFIQSQSFGGVLLGLCALLAIVVANSPLAPVYEVFRQIEGTLGLGDWVQLQKPLILWVNDLWMAVFFFLVGLEIKRELLQGELSSFKQALLPAVAALGGMAAPALIYSLINWGDAVALRGWAIPAATDIAFALGILILLGSRVPASLKVFLTAVAIIDDLGAILVIAFFYTSELSLPMLGLAAAGAVGLFVLNRANVASTVPYVLIGTVVWLGLLKSGVHATLAGVVTALSIPLSIRRSDGHEISPLKRLEHRLHPWVAFMILPMFAFANAGVSLQSVTPQTLLSGIPLGIAAGLVLGKVLGVFGAASLMIATKAADMPKGSSFAQLLGVCTLCGVGFTMSLFIGGLAFEGLDVRNDTAVKLGVLLGSIVAGCLGALILVLAAKRQ